MHTKTRATIATLVASLSFAVGTAGVIPSPAHALKAKPTGNAKLDAYCRGVAKLIDEALDEARDAMYRGDEAEAKEWYALSAEFARRAQRDGCRFTWSRTQAADTQAPRANNTGTKAPAPAR